MKQTNNAIKFLMAQYRAIFKNAYFKGMASALVLTAGFAAGAAQADTTSDTTDWAAETKDAYVVASGNNIDLNLTGSVDLSAGLTLEGVETAETGAAPNRINTANGSFTLTSDGDLTLGKNRKLVIGYGHASVSGGNTTVTFANANVNAEATLEVSALQVTNQGTAGNSVLTIKDTFTTEGAVNIVGTASGSATLNANTFNAESGSVITLSTSTASKTATLDGELLTIGAGATLKMQGNKGDATLAGTNASIAADGVMLTDSGDKNVVSSENFTVEDGAFKIISGAAAVTETFTGHKGVIEGNVLIGSSTASGTWVINSSHDEGTKLEDTDTADTNAYHPGSDDIVGDVTFAAGSNVQLGSSGAITVKRGSLTVEDGAGVYALGEGAKITVGDSTDAGSGDETPTLVISSNSVVEFLSAGDAYNEIKQDSGKWILAETESKDQAGGLVLISGGTLEFTDSETVDLYELVTKDPSDDSDRTIKIGSGSTAAANTINVSGGVIKATNLAVSNGDATNLDLSKATLEADNLTLGSADYANDKISIDNTITHDSLTLRAKDGTFTFNAGTHTLDADYYDSQKDEYGNYLSNTPAQPHYIAGDNFELSGSNTVELKVTGGTWQTKGQNITLGKSGTLTVGAPSDADKITGSSNYLNNGNPATLIVDGGTLTIGDATAKVNVTGASGANATLDLTQVNEVKFTSGAITVSGSALAVGEFADSANAGEFYANAFKDKVGYGILKLNQSTFDDYTEQNGTGVTLTISGSGVVEVSDLHTQDYDVETFTGSSAQAGKVFFNSADSYFVVNGDLNLYDGETTSNGNITTSTDESHLKGLSIGKGTIIADRVDLTIYGRSANSKKENTIVSDAKLIDGTVEVKEAFTTNSSTLVLGGESMTNSATLRLDAGVGNTGILMGAGERTLKLAGTATSGSSVEALTGAWGSQQLNVILSGSKDGLFVGSTDGELIDAAQALSTEETPTYVAQFTGNNFDAAKTSGTVLSVREQSLATFDTMQLGAESTNVKVSGTLVLNGRTNITDKNDVIAKVNPNKEGTASLTAGISLGSANFDVDGPNANLEFGATATSALVNLNGVPEEDLTADSSAITLTKGGIDSAKFNLTDFGHLTLNFASGTAIDAADAKFLTSQLIDSNDSTAYLVLNNADLGIVYETRADGLNEVKWENLEAFINVVGSKATTDKLKTALVSHIPSGESGFKGHYGAASVDSTAALSLAGPTSFHNAAAFGNKFVTSERTGEALGVHFTDENTSLALYNGGEIGSIEGYTNSYDSYNDDYNALFITTEADHPEAVTHVLGSVTKLNAVYIDSATVIDDKLETNFLDLTSSLEVGSTAADAVVVNGGDLSDTAVLTASNLTVGATNSTSQRYASLNVAGSIELSGELTVNNNHDVQLFGGSLKAKDMTLGGSAAAVLVGHEPDTGDKDDPETEYYDESLSYTGSLEVTGITELNGGVLAVDPEYGQATAMASINKLSQAPASTDSSIAGTLDGALFVGQNAALGIGSDSLATLQSKVARFQNGVTLDPNEVGAVVYLGKTLTVGAGQSIILTSQGIEDFAQYYNGNDGVEAERFTTSNILGHSAFDNTVYLGANTALLVDAKAMSSAEIKAGASSNAVISFAGSTGTNSQGKVVADGGEIIIDGDVRAASYQVFGNATISYINGTAYSVVEDSDATHYEDNINVSTENDFLQGVVQADGSVTLGVNPNGRAIMYGASDPVYASLVAYAQGYNGSKPTEEEVTNHPVDTATEGSAYTQIAGVADSRLLYSYDKQGHKTYSYDNYFLQETIATGNGSAAETVARLGVFGGVAQAAIAAGSSTYDAISGRMGVGANGSNITVADNTQGAALWLAPIYKNSDSDSFDAQGVNYGVDMDLYGVALGADYTLTNGLRVGAMFNVGSGDVDGQGAGSSVSNDFDYYGFGAYVGYTMGAMSVVADLSYTVADNDLEGNTAIDKVGASLDSTNLSFGVTGAYQLDVNGFEITPHAGLRYSQIDIDDYTVDGEDIIADYNADSMNIFSIPVGVTFSKEFTGNAWTVKPSFDVTLTGNFGDDETDGTVYWAGVENLSTNVSSEVLDSFTYGATLGVAAKTGNFSLGLGLNYTGSSNTDEFGLQANARFVF